MTDHTGHTDHTYESWGVLELAVELARRGEEFAMATVVWRQAPTSGQQSSRAIVTAGGELHGWIGGACAEPVLIREALRAIEDREPRLLVLGTEAQIGDVPQGVTAIAVSCQSEGALQIYVEPVVAAPHLVVVGPEVAGRGLNRPVPHGPLHNPDVRPVPQHFRGARVAQRMVPVVEHVRYGAITYVPTGRRTDRRRP